MGKRRKSVNDDGSEDGRKRAKVDMGEQVQEIFELLRNHKSSEGKIVCETFLRAPKRRNQADYYEIVKNPIDFMRIQQKVKMDEYDDVEQLTADIDLLVNNTKAYYKDDTQEHQDALKLLEAYHEHKNRVLGDEDEEMSITSSDVGSNIDAPVDIFEEMFTAVMEAESEDGRHLSKMFELLPSKSLYPDYYEVIGEPIDLKMIGLKIQENKYQSLNELDKDLNLMVQNAKTYNVQGSTIFKDANSLKRIIANKKYDIENRKSQSGKSERLRGRRQTSKKWSAVVSSLKYEDDYESNEGTNDETANFSDGEDADSNPYWLLYNAIKDTSISEPFNKLPSKRMYPDYYKEIENPMSLEQVSLQIKNQEYQNVSKLMSDICLIFDNAMSYNRDDSKIFKDAKKLKQILQMKFNEISNFFDENVEEESKSQVVAFEIGKESTSTANRGRKSSKSMANAMSQELKNLRKSQNAVDSHLKKRFKALYKALMDYNQDGDYLIDPFMERPPKKQYPDYYEVIHNPVDMKTIDHKIKNDAYKSEIELIDDFRLLFNNCRLYNEDNSEIYKYANTLERVLERKIKEMGPSPVPSSKVRKERVHPSSATQMKIKKLFEAVNGAKDAEGNRLSTEFDKLPSRIDYPDYYEIIRNPISLEKIHFRVRKNIYETVEDLLSDIILMTDNACKYNDPDSPIFKYSLAIQQIALQTKIDLNEDTVNGIPDVQVIVQDLLTKLFISVYNYQDEEGRCYVDSINELVELSDKNQELKTLNFDLVKKNLHAGRYRRLDRFQQDMFDVFDRIRKIARTDSQAFEDSVEMQQYFINLRNDLCKGGQQLETGALLFDLNMLIAHVDNVRREKAPKEVSEEESKEVSSEMFIGGVTGSAQIQESGETLDNEDMVNYQDENYKVGDFVYIQPSEKNVEPHIMHIEKFIRDPQSGETLIYGCWFYRQYETYHMPSRRFLEKEIFCTDSFSSAALSRIMGKCYVMFVKEYFTSKPASFDDKDIFVCESKYFSKGKSFKKIKMWKFHHTDNIEQRSVPLESSRVPSVFKDKSVGPSSTSAPSEKMAEEEGEIPYGEEAETLPTILDVQRLNIPCNPPPGIETIEGQYYEQFSIPAGTFRVGDCAYVRTDQERSLICRIDRIWVDSIGTSYFHGPWFVQQAELPPGTNGTFYPQEVFLSSIEDTNPLLSICQRCAVFGLENFKKRRPTEIMEKDVYVCEIKYLEHEKRFESLPIGGMDRAINYSPGTTRDEVYYFKNELFLQKNSYDMPFVRENVVSSFSTVDGPILSAIRPSIDSFINEDSNMSALSSGQNSMAGIGDIGAPGTPSTPSHIKSKVKTPKRMITPYIIFASEVRKVVVEKYPNRGFGEISRIIGAEWKNLSPTSKAEYEQRAAKQTAEMKDIIAAEKEQKELMGISTAPPVPAAPNAVIENGLFECLWENKCDFQFEDVNDLHDHLCADSTGHVWTTFAATKNNDPGEFQCQFKGCGRVKKGATPFPNVPRLCRHIKEVHINKAVAKIVDPEKRNRNYVPSSKRPAVEQNTIRMHHQHLQMQHQPGTPGQQMNIQRAVVQTPQGLQTHFIQMPSGAIVTQAPQNMQLSNGAQSNSLQPLQTIQLQSQHGQISQQIQLQQPQIVKQTAEIGVQFPEYQTFVEPPKRYSSAKHSDVYLRYIQNLKPDSKHVSDWPKQLAMLQNKNRAEIRKQTNPALIDEFITHPPTVPRDDLVNYLWDMAGDLFKDCLKLDQ